jgi:hypothetical protein
MGNHFVATIGALGGLVLLAVSLGVIVWLAWWMLEPINRAAGSLRAPTRFMLIDFVSLMILLQIGLAICGTALNLGNSRDDAAHLYWVLQAVVALLVVVLWAASVSVVSRAGILRPLRRTLVTVVLVPGTLATMVGGPALVGALALAIAGLFGDDVEIDRMQRHLFWLAPATLGLVAVVYGFRRLSFWSLKGSTYLTDLKNTQAPAGLVNAAVAGLHRTARQQQPRD